MNEAQNISYPAVNMQCEQVGAIELSPLVFGVEPKPWLVHEVVRWQRAKRRAGSASAKTRTMIKRGNKKPWKQKGTGRARAGSTMSPLWVGGASVHGPSPRSYEFRLAKRSRRQALANVLSDKVSSKNLVVLETVDLEKPSTKAMVKVLHSIGMGDQKCVLLSPERLDVVEKSIRNIPGSLYLTPGSANVYDLVKHRALILTRDAVEALERRVLGMKEV